ncbi:MAG: M3 family metallopeptidase [Betaproteobacteria bacterium]|nr:M3 family metallopeptidase [Betaproteobacteria bacterium]
MTEPIRDNPLLDFSGLPRFADFKPDWVEPALDALLAEARAALEAVCQPATPVRWDTIVVPLEAATERLSRAWGIVGHLNAVDDSPALREVYNAQLPRITQFWTELGQDTRLHGRYKALRASAEFAALSSERQRIIDNALRDFRLGGAELVSPARERYAEIQERQAALSQKFSENLLDATNGFSLFIEDESRLAGLPQDVREAARAEAQADGRSGWKFTLRMPSYLPVMQYAEDRAFREQMYRAYVTRASDLSNSALDNAPLITETLGFRHEEAGLLGYSNFAQVSLEPKMARTPDEVIGFLRDLARRARKFAERDLSELRSFAADKLGLATLQAWDTAWASELLKEARYSFSEQQVKQYFQAPRVLAGMFALVERLFSLRISEEAAQTWHPDVRFYRVERGGQLVGQFYVDLYARASKRGGAWMDDARGRKRAGNRLQTPVAYLNCNFQPPVGDRPATLAHDDVITLFHEFGHGLHHVLTRIDELGVSGINGVEWDAVELPSQFMENFCWEWEVVRDMSAHVDTGEPLLRDLFNRMLAARNFQAGMQTLRQVEFALFDMLLHAQNQAVPDAAAVQTLLDAVRQEVAVLIPPAWNRFQNSFSHIFAGGYAAGYYSYKWAEVLSADCYGAFEEAATDPEALDRVGQRFLEEILSVGGSRPALESFKAFRGREPSPEALLRHSGMVETV